MDSSSKNVSTDKKEYEWEPMVRTFPLQPKRGKKDESISSLAAISGAGGSMTEACIEPGWRIGDIILAAKVLQKANPPPNYIDEAEMRRVFGLVYDVLRCELYQVLSLFLYFEFIFPDLLYKKLED